MVMLGMGLRSPARAVSAEPEESVRQRPDRPDLVTLFLAGDVMTGRGVDQVLPHPGDPRLFETYVASANEYVALAEEANGPIPKPVDFAYVWGDALAELERRRPDVRLVNLETAVTKSEEPWPKTVNYRMSPENVPVLTAARVDCCALANNHILDWGERGLLETLETLRKAGVSGVGAGRDLREAAAPAIVQVPGKGRVIVFGFGSVTSGIPGAWAATDRSPGVNLVPDLSSRTVRRIADDVRAVKGPGDVVVASLHWGGNWGYEISGEEIAFAHGLIDEAGVDTVYGHSSHHPKAIEVHRGKPILYGCGDFLDDYEGISGFEEFRDDLVLMYFPAIRPSDGTLAALALVPLQIRNMRLNRASAADAAWLRDVMNREGERFATRFELGPDNALTLAGA
jgi:poly-gamma-glutamate synthesis protein (capsule biosynthesis protein)